MPSDKRGHGPGLATFDVVLSTGTYFSGSMNLAKSVALGFCTRNQSLRDEIKATVLAMYCDTEIENHKSLIKEFEELKGQ